MNNLTIDIAKTKTVTLEADDPAKLPVASLLFAEATINSKTSEITFTIHEVGPKRSWRLVHDGKRVVTLFESDGYTTSAYQIFEAGTEAECFDEIKRCNLVYEPEVI
jgi:hypothetical protein